MQFPGYFRWLQKVLICRYLMCSLLFTMFLCSCYDILVGCQGVAMQFLGYAGWLSRC